MRAAVSKDPGVVRSLWSIVEANSWQLETVGSGWEALESVQAGTTPDLLLLDLPRGDADSLHILRWLGRRPRRQQFSVKLPRDNIRSAVSGGKRRIAGKHMGTVTFRSRVGHG